jgi:hypothetical protein
MRFHIRILILLLFALSACSDNSNDKNRAREYTLQQEQIKHNDSMETVIRNEAMEPYRKKENELRQKKMESVRPDGGWQSYPQIVRSIFSMNSTKEEVQAIMGTPEYIEQTYNENNQRIETWFYGKIEIGFRKGQLTSGNDYLKKFEKYADIDDLITSSDEYEKRLGLILLSRSNY